MLIIRTPFNKLSSVIKRRNGVVLVADRSRKRAVVTCATQGNVLRNSGKLVSEVFFFHRIFKGFLSIVDVMRQGEQTLLIYYPVIEY